jgi:GNAT superfamily N-acetyltransferase
MGAWDGRRGWIYHVAVVDEERRQGLATRLVREVERRLVNEGCWRVNVLVRDGNADGEGFWRGVGYAPRDGQQFARELTSD